MDSPYEVHDYIRAYLGDTPESKDFAKQFLERRAKQNANQQKQAPSNQQLAKQQQQVKQCLNSSVGLSCFNDSVQMHKRSNTLLEEFTLWTRSVEFSHATTQVSYQTTR